MRRPRHSSSPATFITPCGPFDQPISHIRVAVLTLTVLLAAVVSAELSVDRPLMTHALKIDLWDPAYQPEPVTRGPVHVLAVRADGRMTFAGAPVANLRELRQLVDLDQQRVPVPMLRVEPDARLRYADFLRVVAMIKRANVYQYCIDFDPERQFGAGLNCARRRYMD